MICLLKKKKKGLQTKRLDTRGQRNWKLSSEGFVTNQLLLLLSPLSHVRLCGTPQTAAHQAPPSLGFSRQEHWSGLPFPSQCMTVKSESDVAQSCPTLSDPMDCSLPGSSVCGIFQARVLEWGATNQRDQQLEPKGDGLWNDTVEETSNRETKHHTRKVGELRFITPAGPEE